MALENTLGENQSEREYFIFQEKFIIYCNTQKISNQLISTRKINFCLNLHAEQQKSNFDFPMNIKLLEIPAAIYYKGFCKTGGIGEHILLCPCHSAVQ